MRYAEHEIGVNFFLGKAQRSIIKLQFVILFLHLFLSNLRQEFVPILHFICYHFSLSRHLINRNFYCTNFFLSMLSEAVLPSQMFHVNLSLLHTYQIGFFLKNNEIRSSVIFYTETKNRSENLVKTSINSPKKVCSSSNKY